MVDAEGNPLRGCTAAQASARIVRNRLDTLESAARHLSDAEDTDALHDFRVALRRLRSALRAYRRWLERAAARKIRTRLRELGHRTNQGRDAEVQAGWIERSGAYDAEDREGDAEKLMRKLRKVRAPRTSRIQREVGTLAARIRERLARVHDEGEPFAAAYSSLVTRHVNELASRLAAVNADDQEEEIHEARIAAKRLRYLLEPMTEESSTAADLLPRLERLQDLLGEIHDAHVLEETLRRESAARPALSRLREANRRRRQERFAALRDEGWLDPAAERAAAEAWRLAEAFLAEK